eukprot:scaffold395_cov243-Pinguiococcus_pyrenoidosus.AAC.7
MQKIRSRPPCDLRGRHRLCAYLASSSESWVSSWMATLSSSDARKRSEIFLCPGNDQSSTVSTICSAARKRARVACHKGWAVRSESEGRGGCTDAYLCRRHWEIQCAKIALKTVADDLDA